MEKYDLAQESQPCGLPAQWDEEVDVAVIGTGFAGLAAAIEAKSAGASVVVLEKMKGYGGNSTISDGAMAAAGTQAQQKLGIQDSPARMYDDMVKAGLGLNQPELVRTLTESSAETFQWTVDYLGVEYMDRVDQFGGHSFPRSITTHNSSGAAIIKQLLYKAREQGIRIRTRIALQTILKDRHDRVCGITVREGWTPQEAGSGVLKHIKARRAVILASGGFGNDIKLRTTQDPRLTEEIDSTNKFSTTGEALVEALRIGAMPVHLSWIQLGPWASPDEKGYGCGPEFAAYIAFIHGIVVDPATGKRFVSELADRKIRADAILTVGHPCIGIADAHGVACSGRDIRHGLKKGVVKEFETVDALAGFYKIPKTALLDTVSRFNRFVSSGRDEDFNKPLLPDVRPLIKPPFYAVRLWPKVHYTMGGILINPKAQVLDLENRPMEGFYAAGEVTGGVHGACRLGSCAITDCLVFGRIAGKNAATG